MNYLLHAVLLTQTSTWLSHTVRDSWYERFWFLQLSSVVNLRRLLLIWRQGLIFGSNRARVWPFPETLKAAPASPKSFWKSPSSLFWLSHIHVLQRIMTSTHWTCHHHCASFILFSAFSVLLTVFWEIILRCVAVHCLSLDLAVFISNPFFFLFRFFFFFSEAHFMA